MKGLIRRDRKQNNKGMTLVELIIAIAIFAIAVIPLMYAFVNVARFSGRGREIQQTTSIAHTIMENCKAYSTATIRNMMDPAASEHFMDASFTEGYSVGGHYTDTYDFDKFYLDDVAIDGQKYDVCFELSPYTASGVSTVDLMRIEDINPLLDGIFIAQSTMDETNTVKAYQLDEKAYYLAMEKIAAQVNDFTADTSNGYEATSLTAQDVEESFRSGGLNESRFFVMRRNIYVDMAESSNDEKVVVSYEYEYAISNGASEDNKFFFEGKKLPTPSNPTPTEEPVELITTGKIYDKSNPTEAKKFVAYSNSTTNDVSGYTDVELQDLYLFYVPGYKNVAVVDYPINKDTFIINNGLGRAINIYLIKQRDLGIVGNDEAVGGARLLIAEATYKPVIKGAGNVVLYHNLDSNLVNEITKSESDSFANAWTGLGLEAEASSNLVNTSPTQLMYKIDINIYRSNAYNVGTNTIDTTSHTPVLSMDGTKVDW